MLKLRRNDVAPPPEGCALTLCVRFLRGAWTPNILWYLGHRSRRFSELKHDLGGISSKVLTQRLRRLEADGLIHKQRQPTSPPSVEYALTDLGRELQPALAALIAVGEKIKRAPAQNQPTMEQREAA
ncbi:MAG TPA: helix-turn-helix domain-containing protein [Steroidobacteraceae bacterium]|nr:helix-turn-helix domain-containing protein [Steroidobacteraceae bacterium]